jgi:peptidoglycan/xylan/chitin deacetylase (PgdA/CDA1 family)
MKKAILPALMMVVFTMACIAPLAAESSADYPKPDKICALTFDDGPDVEKTALVLDKLEKYGVVATFMMIGQNVNDNTKPVIDRVVSMKCEIGNHSWAWNSMNQMTPAEIKDSIKKTSAAIKKYSGVKPKFFRPPNLAVGDVMYDNVGLPFVEGVLGFDWAGCNTTAEQRANNVISGMQDGAIILLHDVQPYPHPTPEALDILIPELKKQGYEFVTLSELFARKGVKPDPKAHRMWKYVE